jgi:soluble lytic murein transglycosylase-like protein
MPVDYRAIAKQKAEKYGLLPEVFLRQITQESGFNPNVKSPAGAIGIAQIMPGTASDWGVNPNDPVASLDAAARNMAEYINSYGGNATKDPVKVRSAYEKALQAYNAGPGSVGKY